jgi:8-oxo-dGTP diphosphatase/2-hydroxy-dATP diphosphatase
MTRIETLCIVYQPPRILLATKKKRLGKGRYNGFGGGLKKDETIEECAIRETSEEAGIVVKDIQRYGEILFQFQTNEQDHLVHFFRASQYTGTPKETDEMKPEWFDIDKIPYDNMWKADRLWLPLLLKNEKFKGHFIYDKDHQIASYHINPVQTLE